MALSRGPRVSQTIRKLCRRVNLEAVQPTPAPTAFMYISRAHCCLGRLRWPGITGQSPKAMPDNTAS